MKNIMLLKKIKKLTIKIFLFFSLMQYCGLSSAQSTLPVEQRQVFYFYQEFGLPGSKDVKVLIIGDYLYRYPLNDNSHSMVETALSLAFNKKVNKIKDNEYNSNARLSSLQVIPVSSKLEFAYWNNGPHATGPELYESASSTSKLMSMKRDKIIEEYRAKGYTVLQTGIEEYYDSNLQQYKLERIDKLSPLYVAVYKPGDIRSIAKRYQERPGSDSPKKSSSSSTSSSTSSSSAANEAALRSWDASLYEAEGDRLLKAGDMSGAIQQYEASLNMMFTDRVQNKLKNAVGSQQALLSVIGGGLDAAAGISNFFDELKIPKFHGWRFNYSGIPTGPQNPAVPSDQIPFSTGITLGTYRIIAMEIGFSYVQSPVFEFGMNDVYGDKTNHTIKFNRSSIGATASFGLAIPIKFIVLYGMYGWNIPFFITGSEVYSAGFTYPESKRDLGRMPFDPKAQAGIKIKIPGTTLAVGAHYGMNKYSGGSIKQKTNHYSTVKKSGKEYRLTKSIHESYQYESFGISLYILTGKKK